MTAKHFDRITVGGGSAASVLADGLSRDGTRTVRIPETGRSDRPAGLVLGLALPARQEQFHRHHVKESS